MDTVSREWSRYTAAALLSEFAGNPGCQTRDTKPEVDTTTIGATVVPLVTVPVTEHQQKTIRSKDG